MYKIPPELLLNFFDAEFNIKKTSDANEIRINSIYNQDTKFHCYINLQKGVYCDYKMSGLEEGTGSVLKLIKNYLDLDSTRQVLQYVILNYGTPVQKQKAEQLQIKGNVIENFLKEDKPSKIKGNNGIFCKTVRAYLEERKISEKYIDRMMYVLNDDSRYDKRVIIPYFENGEFVYFQARSLEKEAKLRYINPVGIDTKEFVFNIDDINDELIICEGPFDAMSMDEQAATCMCSGDLGIKQIEKIIAKKPNYIIYARDNDETGSRTMKKNIGKLIMYGYDKPIYLFEMPEHIKDLNELKMKTGKNFILKKECSLYKQTAFNDQWLQKLTF